MATEKNMNRLWFQTSSIEEVELSKSCHSVTLWRWKKISMGNPSGSSILFVENNFLPNYTHIHRHAIDYPLEHVKCPIWKILPFLIWKSLFLILRNVLIFGLGLFKWRESCPDVVGNEVTHVGESKEHSGGSRQDGANAGLTYLYKGKRRRQREKSAVSFPLHWFLSWEVVF